MPTRLTGAALPLGQDRAASAALAFYVAYMKNLPLDQRQTTEGSEYMHEVELLRDELILRTPALEEILASPVNSRLLARMTHVVDDNAAVQLLDSLPDDVANRRLAMLVGGSYLDATGTSDSELVTNDV